MHFGIRSQSSLSSNKANELKTEQDLRKICHCSGSGQLPIQDDLDNLHQFLSLYNPMWKDEKTELHIYDTENESKEIKTFDRQLIHESASITQLPNGELFCYGKSDFEFGRALIIDKNYEARMLPPGTPCYYSSALYFDNNIYFFGGYLYLQGEMALSRKFDLETNRWIDLAQLPSADFYCHSVIFNGDILISGFRCENLWLYSIEIDSFSTISYEFEQYKRKVLINVERLYLIEWHFKGMIYESEDECNWKPIKELTVTPALTQMCWVYNKEKVYISTWDKYYQFDLKEKAVYKIK